MVTFHVVYVAAPVPSLSGWAVLRTSLDDPTVVVTPVYPNIADADIEAERLTKMEPPRFHA
jgi:hypothetical protein